jgi:hypothetical protein
MRTASYALTPLSTPSAGLKPSRTTWGPSAIISTRVTRPLSRCNIQRA